MESGSIDSSYLDLDTNWRFYVTLHNPILCKKSHSPKRFPEHVHSVSLHTQNNIALGTIFSRQDSYSML